MNRPHVLISACLTGENCKYNGGNNLAPEVLALLQDAVLIPVCPEVAGGLPCPRVPAEILNDSVINRDGVSVDAAFRAGATQCLAKASQSSVDFAVLQPRSPSCGVTQVYDGTFTGTLRAGEGIFAAALREAGIPAADASNLNQISCLLASAKINAMPDGLSEDVAAVFAQDSSGHDRFHTERVLRLAERIARKEGANLHLVRLAALLHDVDDRKLPGSDPVGMSRTRSLMTCYGIPTEEQEQVCHIIRQVSFKGTDSVQPDSLEGCCVQDADRLDAIGAIGVARTFAFGGSRGRLLYDPEDPPKPGLDDAAYAKSTGATINHFYEKLLLLRDMMNTDTARVIAAERHAWMESFLERFFGEWNGTM